MAAAIASNRVTTSTDTYTYKFARAVQTRLVSAFGLVTPPSSNKLTVSSSSSGQHQMLHHQHSGGSSPLTSTRSIINLNSSPLPLPLALSLPHTASPRSPLPLDLIAFPAFPPRAPLHSFNSLYTYTSDGKAAVGNGGGGGSRQGQRVRAGSGSEAGRPQSAYSAPPPPRPLGGSESGKFWRRTQSPTSSPSSPGEVSLRQPPRFGSLSEAVVSAAEEALNGEAAGVLHEVPDREEDVGGGVLVVPSAQPRLSAGCISPLTTTTSRDSDMVLTVTSPVASFSGSLPRDGDACMTPFAVMASGGVVLMPEEEEELAGGEEGAEVTVNMSWLVSSTVH